MCREKLSHAQRVEGAPIDDCERVDTAMQCCEADVSVGLRNHCDTLGARWATWESFSRHMKATYGSQDTGFQRCPD
jgi:hypothetical protein